MPASANSTKGTDVTAKQVVPAPSDIHDAGHESGMVGVSISILVTTTLFSGLAAFLWARLKCKKSKGALESSCSAVLNHQPRFLAKLTQGLKRILPRESNTNNNAC